MSRPTSRVLALLAALLASLAAFGAVGCARDSRPWACCGQECGSTCWPGPRIGCPERCLSQPCPPERWTPPAPEAPCAAR